MEFGPSRQTMHEGHLPWSDSMVHGVNRPLLALKKEEVENLKGSTS